MLKILIAVDGSTHALRAIDAVSALAKAGAAIEVTLLNVRDAPVYYGELPPTSIEALAEGLKARQEAVLKEAEKHVVRCGLKLAGVLRGMGWASAEILREAADLRVDQIVLGTRGLGAMGSLVLGSVAQRVVHDAKVPVLLVK